MNRKIRIVSLLAFCVSVISCATPSPTTAPAKPVAAKKVITPSRTATPPTIAKKTRSQIESDYFSSEMESSADAAERMRKQ